MSPERRGTLLSAFSLLEPTEGHVFYLSGKSLALLHETVFKTLTSNSNDNDNDNDNENKTYVSDNDIITALASAVVAQGATACFSSRARFADSKEEHFLRSFYQAAKHEIKSQCKKLAMPSKTHGKWTTAIVVDARCRLKKIAESNYTGNAVFALPLQSTLEDMHQKDFDQTLATLAKAIRAAVSCISEPGIAQIVDMVSQTSHSYARALGNTLLDRRKVVVSNQSRFPLYDVDFGFGCPEWISPIPAFYANFVSILPKNAKIDGFHIYITASKKAMKQILANKSWLQYVRLVY